MSLTQRWGNRGRFAKVSYYEKLRQSLSIGSYDLLKEYHKGWVGEYLGIVQQNL